VQGYAWFHLSNARRFTSDLPGADHALATARQFWEAGVLGDQGLLNEAVVLALEANQHQYQRRFPLALRRIEEALAIDTGEIRGKLLFTKARILETLGDSEASTEVLHEAIPQVDEQRDPRTALGVQFLLVVNHCLRGRAIEAEPLLSHVRALAEMLGMEADLKRVVWLEGKVAAGVGRAADAESAFEEVRRYFAAEKLGFDYALVCLDLALLLLEQGRTAEVRTLAAEMAWIFTNQGVHREALAALRIFCDAARQEEATVELARKIVHFLHRSQHDPGLPFDATA
jgi:tetratricopeptide (TPR) repeat protein